MDEYIVEIDELDDDIVVVVAPALCLLVFGRTLEHLGQLLDAEDMWFAHPMPPRFPRLGTHA